MIISHRKAFIAYSPWKTASSTLTVRLLPYDDSPYNRFYDFNPYLGRVVHQHLTCADFALLPESRLGHFAISFSRNPYDRVYSGFRQLQKDIVEQPKAIYPSNWIRQLVMRQLSMNFAQLCRASFDFDEWWALIDEHQIYEAAHNSSFPLYPNYYWTHIAGKQVVDFIGKVENFENDFEALCARLDVPKPEAVNVNVYDDKIPDSLEGRARYVDKMNRRSIDKVNELFARDFELFGYDRL
jgi:hypothetical protein